MTLAIVLSACSAAPAGQGRAVLDSQERTAIESLLLQRTQAVRGGDVARWLATVDPHEASLRDTERARFEGMTELPLTDVEFELMSTDLPGAVQVRVSYTLAGLPRADHVDVVTVNSTDAGWRFGDSHPAVAVDAGGTVPPWYLPGVHALSPSGSGTLLTWPGTVGQAAELAGYLATGVDSARAAVPAAGNGQVWALVAAPGSAADYRSLVPGTGEQDSAFAAVTATVPGPGRGGSTVVLNPDQWPALDSGERQVVLTHELVHARVATVIGGGEPLWLAEGFADHVALRPVLESGVTRAQLADADPAIVADPAAADLPTAADFADRNSGAYTVAWLAVDYIARTHGEQSVLDLITALARPIGVSPSREEEDAALVTVLGVDRPTLLSMWRADLQATVGSP